MRFSVIIPCYNAASTIERALDSLVNQPYLDWEVICVDDCSKDNTVELIRIYSEKHKDAKIQIICNEKNSGPGVSRNNGIAIAQGEFLCFLDADDYYANDYFELINEAIANTDAEIIFYGYNQVIGRKVRHRPFVPYQSHDDYIALVGGSFWGGVWHRKLWEGIFIPALKNAEDIAVIPVLISRAKKVEGIPNCLYNYIYSNNSLSGKHVPQVSYNFVSSFHYTLQHIDIDRYRDEVEFHGIKTIVYGATLNAIKSGINENIILELWSEFENKFPNWNQNIYLSRYSKTKRIFVWLASHRMFMVLKLYTKLHSLILRAIG